MALFGVDASSQFVNVLNASEAYSEAREVWLGTDNFDDDLKNRFDIVTASGVFLKSHIPSPAMNDCYAALKVGGYFVTAMRAIYWNPGNEEGYREKLDQFVEEGKFKLVTHTQFRRGVEGEVGLFAPCESHMVCYQKIA